MKKMLFALLSFVMLAAGCTKEESIENKIDLSYHVRFVVDGQPKEYKENVLALRTADSSLYRVTIQGLADLSANPSGVAVVVSEPFPIVAQTYPEVLGSDSPAILYRDTSGMEYTNLFLTSTSGIEVVVSQIDSATIRGTFRGAVADTNGVVKEITDGSFYAPFQ